MELLNWVALAGVTTLASGGLLASMKRRLRSGLAVQVAGMALLGVVGVAVLIDGEVLGASFRNTIGLAFGLDPLSGFFLAVLALTAVPTLVFARDYLPASPGARAIGALMSAFLLTLVGVLAARSVTGFLAFWELMTLVPAAAMLVARRDATVRSATYAYLAITHLGGAGVWIALVVLVHYGAIGDPSALVSAGGDVQTLVAVAALIGFGTKAGFVPLHSWLPRAHPVAPAPLSALMSGVMIKVALYGLIRVEFQWLGATPQWLGLALLAIGLVSSLGGVLWALVQHDLKRLLAYHSIENVGIIALALGASVLFADGGSPMWAAIAFGAALLHVVNHAIFKSLLFLGAGALERAVGSLDLDNLGGLLRRMPWVGGAFLIGSMAIAGLPPLNGFASEWLVLQSLLHVAFYHRLGVALAGAIALAGLAATAALALLCFAKVIGLVLLGQPRRAECAVAVDPPVGHAGGDGGARRAVRCARPRSWTGTANACRAFARNARSRSDATCGPGDTRYRLLPSACTRPGAGRHHNGAGGSAREASGGPDAELGLRAAGRRRARMDLGGIYEAAAARTRGRASTAPGDRGHPRRRAWSRA